MSAKRKYKNKMIYFSPEEWEAVCKRSEILGLRPGTYIRQIAVYGEIKKYNFKEIADVRIAFDRIGTNINQITAVANSTGSIYQKDVEDIQAEMKQLRKVIDNWLEPLEMELI